jgi:hypothetical protein
MYEGKRVVVACVLYLPGKPRGSDNACEGRGGEATEGLGGGGGGGINLVEGRHDGRHVVAARVNHAEVGGDDSQRFLKSCEWKFARFLEWLYHFYFLFLCVLLRDSCILCAYHE